MQTFINILCITTEQHTGTWFALYHSFIAKLRIYHRDWSLFDGDEIQNCRICSRTFLIFAKTLWNGNFTIRVRKKIQPWLLWLQWSKHIHSHSKIAILNEDDLAQKLAKAIIIRTNKWSKCHMNSFERDFDRSFHSICPFA